MFYFKLSDTKDVGDVKVVGRAKFNKQLKRLFIKI